LEEENIAHLTYRTNSLDKKLFWKTSDRNAYTRNLTQEMPIKEEIFGNILAMSMVNVVLPLLKNALRTSTVSLRVLPGKKL